MQRNASTQQIGYLKLYWYRLVAQNGHGRMGIIYRRLDIHGSIVVSTSFLLKVNYSNIIDQQVEYEQFQVTHIF